MNPVDRILGRTFDVSKNKVTYKYYAVHVSDHLNQPVVDEVDMTNDPVNYVQGKGLTKEGKWLQNKTIFDFGEGVIGFDANQKLAENKALKRWYATLHKG